MANVVLFTNGQAQYLESVNTPEYSDNPNAIVSPDLSTVSGVPIKYWKRSGNNIVEMTQAEKDAITASELTQRKSAADTFQGNPVAIFTALIKVINLRLPAGQKITKAEMITAIKEEIT